MLKYYQSIPLADGVRQITDAVGGCMYLVEGEKYAALIDTGTGYGSVKEFVTSLTDLPVLVLLTHGHFDHAGGSYDFDRIYAGSKDIDLMQSPHCSVKQRAGYVKMIRPDLMSSLDERDFTVQRKISYRPVYEGDMIELGGRKLEVVEVPGHTVGSVAYLDYENKVAFTGDAVSLRTILFQTMNGGGMKNYLCTLKKFMEFSQKVDHMYWGHDDGNLPVSCIYNVLNCCIEILNGKDEHIPFEFMGESGYSAHQLLPDNLNRADGKIGNIVYQDILVR